MVLAVVVVVVECQADHSAVNPCLNLSNTRRLGHHLSLQHSLHIVHLLNNQSTHVWVAAAAVAALICADQWICVRNPGEAVVGFKPISLYLYN
jgi:hypothetical protein